MSDEPQPGGARKELCEVERVKAASRYLRGTIAESLADRLTAAIAESDTHLLKFHGTYQQDDRDLRLERQRQKLEPAFEFMIRVRAAGGIVTPAQWLVLDRLARQYGSGTLRLTTRQAVQIHGVLKWNLRATIREINEALLTTMATCGDVNRNVMCNPNPVESDIHAEVYRWSRCITEHLLPKTTAYYELWLAGEKIADSRRPEGAAVEDDEPIYGPTYLPRKFKIAVAVPPSNDVDVFSNDLGFIAIVERGKLAGFNVVAGGGLGMTHGEPQTYPNLAWMLGFCRPEQAVEVAEKVILAQRDFGDRTNRKHARLKYTIDDRGVEWFKEELHRRLGWSLEPARPYRFEHRGDRYGWARGTNDRWHLTLWIENGRIRDRDDGALMTGLRSIAERHDGDFRVTANQNLVVGNVREENKSRIDELVERFKLDAWRRCSPLRREAMACVALPTCPLAMAESERYLPELLGKLEAILAEAGLAKEAIVVRMTGCPNGCARPYLAEIGLVGKAVGAYNVYLGGDFAGERMNRLYRENIGEQEILDCLRPLVLQYAKEREPGERFGDFCVRTGHVRAVASGRDFHET